MKKPQNYSQVVIIYNPHSTGSSRRLADELKDNLHRLMPQQKVTLVATKRRRHAEHLAYKIALESPQPLIVASSGDGGYHEVINGLMRAQREGAKPIAGLLPAGNANDHYHHLHEDDSAEEIRAGNIRQVDLLKITGQSRGKTFERYAHSYIGFGLTPNVAQELNKTKLNRFNEFGISIRSILLLRPVRLIIRDQERSYDSIIFSNINKMSKVLSLSKRASAHDGKFEVTAFRRRNKVRLLAALLRASTTGLSAVEWSDDYELWTTSPTRVQLDGELFELDANSKVVVSIEPQVLQCII